MKKVEAIIREDKLEAVKEALAESGFPALTVYEVHGRGQQKGIVRVFRGREYRIDILPKMKVEVVCDDNQVDRVVGLIVDSARTGAVGDGKIFVLPVENVIRVRTAERLTSERYAQSPAG